MSASSSSSSSSSSRFCPRDHNCCLKLFTAILGVLALSGVVNWFYFQGRIESCISVGEMMTGLPENDTRIIRYISTYHLVPPSTLPYNFANKSRSSATDSGRNGSSSLEASLNYSVQKILKFKKKGFFVECSAFDGETSSRTLALEMDHEWTGLLIEPDPFVFPRLVFKHRKAWTSDVCLSPDKFPQRLEFLHRIDEEETERKTASLQRPTSSNDTSTKPLAFKLSSRWRKVQVPCFPLYSVLSALRTSHVDYMSLEVQGLELQVLRTIPWNLVQIDVISVSYSLVPEGPEALKSYLESVGFWLVSDFPRVYLFANQMTIPANNRTT